ncbi:hypothetical protein PINS_up004847 [Pythium insidiosum]|nr:hypothetical protein PINS_up004847 [Pythium insidiosum]
MLQLKSLLVAAGITLGLPTLVSAHGAILSPKPVFFDPPNRNAPSALFPGEPGPYTGNDVIRDLANQHGSNCGKTDPNAPVQPIPADGVVQLDITAAHIGPCELWLNDKLVASARECVKQYADRKIPVDFSSCRSSKCQVRWVWLATHNYNWEVFDNCVNVGGGNAPNPAPGPAPGPVPTAAPSSVPSVRPTPVPVTSAPTAAPAPVDTKRPQLPTEPATLPLSTQAPSSTPSPSDGYEPGNVIPGYETDTSKFRSVDGTFAMDWWCLKNCERGFCPEDKCVRVEKA